MDIWPRLKERKLVQWALAYLAGAWLVQVFSELRGACDCRGKEPWPQIGYEDTGPSPLRRHDSTKSLVT